MGDEHKNSQIDADQSLAEALAASEATMYEYNRQHIEHIEDEVRKTQPLFGEKKNISEGLVAEYDPDTSPEYFRKASELAETYGHIRKIRGDGNCFYRAALSAAVEHTLDDPSFLRPFAEAMKGWRQRLRCFGFPELTTADFCDAMDTLMDGIVDGVTNREMLFDNFNQDGIANYYVAFARIITSGYLRENEALYSGFIEGLRTLDQYCRDEIEPMWRDCDHLSVIALVNALGVNLRIEYMDRSLAPDGGWHHDLLAKPEAPIQLYMLFRPGHYDLLYKKT